MHRATRITRGIRFVVVWTVIGFGVCVLNATLGIFSPSLAE